MIQKLKTLKRHPVKFKANEKRVICRLFNNTEKNAKGIAKRTAKHVLALSEQEINEVYEHIKNEFGSRHRDLDGLLLSHFYSIAHFLDKTSDISEISKKVLGSYFSMEYSIEAAALFNPSIVLHPDQSGLNNGCVRFVMSLRATGEGHISSVEFMSGEINSSGEILMDPVSPYAATPRKIVNEMKTNGKVEVYFDPNIPLSERVIFPITEEERNGIEDVRLVHFSDEPGSRYYGTFTAYDGRNIRSKMFETKDFINFKIHTLNGKAVQDKGMALFPRKINGQYAMISRQDGDNIRIMYSGNIKEWRQSTILCEPKMPWEYVKIGNCGSPLKTEHGWLLLTHGVGPMRKYEIGACLLDLHQPHKVIKRLKLPFLSPNEEEREGYVPNVVYSGGGIIHNEMLVLPYAMSDSASGFVTVSLNELIEAME